MSYDRKSETGSLFRVPDKKKTSEHFPEYSGEFKTTCPHCHKQTSGWISAWIKTTKAGEKFFSMAFKYKVPRASNERARDPELDV
jgi:hypothetical protein